MVNLTMLLLHSYHKIITKSGINKIGRGKKVLKMFKMHGLQGVQASR